MSIMVGYVEYKGYEDYGRVCMEIRYYGGDHARTMSIMVGYGNSVHRVKLV